MLDGEQRLADAPQLAAYARMAPVFQGARLGVCSKTRAEVERQTATRELRLKYLQVLGDLSFRVCGYFGAQC